MGPKGKPLAVSEKDFQCPAPGSGWRAQRSGRRAVAGFYGGPIRPLAGQGGTLLSQLNLPLATESIKKPGRADTRALSLEAIPEGAGFDPAKDPRAVELGARTAVNSESGRPAGPASCGALAGGGVDGDVCVPVCLLSCSPFAFGLSHQTAAVPESCPINIED